MFTAALFTIAKIWKQSKCPSTDEWIKKMWYIYNGCYSAIKGMKSCHFWQHGWTWGGITLSEINQTEKDKFFFLRKTNIILSHLYVEYSKKTKTETDS